MALDAGPWAAWSRTSVANATRAPRIEGSVLEIWRIVLSQNGLSKYPEKGLVHTIRKNSSCSPSCGRRNIFGGLVGLGRSLHLSTTPKTRGFLVVDGGGGRHFCGFMKSQERPVVMHGVHAGLASLHFTWRILDVLANYTILEWEESGSRPWRSNLQVRQPVFDLGTPFRSLFGFSRPAEAVSTTILGCHHLAEVT